MSVEGDALGVAIANAVANSTQAMIAAGQPVDRITIFKALGSALFDNFAPDKLETADKIVALVGSIAEGTVLTMVSGKIVGEALPTGLPPIGAAGGDLVDTFPSPHIAPGAVTASKIASGTITDTQVATANKDGAAGTPSMRTLGTGAQQACAGNDSRLSDARIPTGPASGDLAATFPSPSLAAAGPGAGTYGGGSTYVNSVTLDTKGRVTAVATGTPGGGGVAGALSVSQTNVNASVTVNLSTEGTKDWFAPGGSTANPPRGSSGMHGRIIGGELLNGFDWVNVQTLQTAGSNVTISSNAGDDISAPLSSVTTAQQQTTGTNSGPTNWGFRLRCRAGTASRTLKIYVKIGLVDITLTAHLSDGSAADVTSTLSTGNSSTVFVVTFNSATEGEELYVSVLVTGNHATAFNGAYLMFTAATLA